MRKPRNQPPPTCLRPPEPSSDVMTTSKAFTSLLHTRQNLLLISHIFKETGIKIPRQQAWRFLQAKEPSFGIPTSSARTNCHLWPKIIRSPCVLNQTLEEEMLAFVTIRCLYFLSAYNITFIMCNIKVIIAITSNRINYIIPRYIMH